MHPFGIVGGLRCITCFAQLHTGRASSLAALKASPATARAKAKAVLASDEETCVAEDFALGETIPTRIPTSSAFSASRRHHDCQAGSRKLLRHPRHRPFEPA